MTHADHAVMHGEGRVTGENRPPFPALQRQKEGEGRFLCKSCPGLMFFSARQLVGHVHKHREACNGC